MHDPFLKSVFADRRMIEILIRTHVRRWADRIDFSTLRAEPTELVSQETLERRHPDMVWSARTHTGIKVLLLLEFQRTAGGDPPPTDVAATVLGLARNLTAEEMVASLPAVRLALEEHGDPDLERFMAERVGTMLHLRGYPVDMRAGGARTMAETVDRFRQSLDEMVQRGVRRGMRRGIRRPSSCCTAR